jgi:hypothetical protein
MVVQSGVEDRGSVKMALNVCVQAKNSTWTRNGLSLEQAVFGRALRWPAVAGTVDENEIPLAYLRIDGGAWLPGQTRTAVHRAVLFWDASNKVRQAVLRRAPVAVGDLSPDTRAYFWNPHPMKGGRRQDAHRWCGPAMVIAREGVGRYYVGWRSRVLLVDRGQLRLATTEEAAASEPISKDMVVAADSRTYQDMTCTTPPVRRAAAQPPVVPVAPMVPLQDMPRAVMAFQDEFSPNEKRYQAEDVDLE